MAFLTKLIKNTWYKALLLLLVGVAMLLCLYFFAFNNGGIVRWCDSAFITGAFIFFVGCFQIILNQGTFDLFNYSLANLWSVFMFHDEKKYVDAMDYKEKKKSIRKESKFNFLIYFIIGFIFILIALLFYGIYKYNFNQ